MFDNKKNSIVIIDRIISFFIIIFLLSLTNSIFVNQIGYFGALIFILIKVFISKQNQFKKTGLEFLFVWYIVAEVLSAIFSVNSAAAFHNAFKRALFIPLVYTAIAVIPNIKKAKTYFAVYIGASLLTALIYVYFSLSYYINNLYSITGSGPSLFKYPITASEILSFAVIFLFAFLINEKSDIKTKILYLASFLLSALALVSTYKRTGWIGAAFGIFVILLVKKQWKILALGFAALAVVFAVQKNLSIVTVYNYSQSEISKYISFSTEGRASDITRDNGFYFVSDYENGLTVYKDSSLISKIILQSPVISLKKWKDQFYAARLVDYRFALLKKENDKFSYVNEFLSPGFTSEYESENGFIYILDLDSGLTVFTNPLDLSQSIRFKDLNKYNKIFVDSTRMVLFSVPNKAAVFKLKNFLPQSQIFQKHFEQDVDFVYYTSGKVFVSGKNTLRLYDISNDGFQLTDSVNSVPGLFYWSKSDNHLFTSSLGGELYEFDLPIGDKIIIKNKYELDFPAQSIAFGNNKLFTTFNKRSRLLSIFDPYLPSNFVRLALWRAGFKIFNDYPIFGVGDIDLQKIYKNYKRPFDKEIQGHMHNNFMHVLVTLGLFGFIPVLLIFISLVIYNYKIYLACKDESFISSYALGALGSFCAFLASGLTELNFGDQEIITLVWFTFGFNLALYFMYKNSNQNFQNDKV